MHSDSGKTNHVNATITRYYRGNMCYENVLAPVAILLVGTSVERFMADRASAYVTIDLGIDYYTRGEAVVWLSSHYYTCHRTNKISHLV